MSGLGFLVCFMVLGVLTCAAAWERAWEEAGRPVVREVDRVPLVDLRAVGARDEERRP